MATEYKTSDGEMLDKLVWNFYGFLRPGMVEQVLESNPHLADFGPRMPAGLVIVMPDIKPEPVRNKRLWS
jgi:phage tail protein X